MYGLRACRRRGADQRSGAGAVGRAPDRRSRDPLMPHARADQAEVTLVDGLLSPAGDRLSFVRRRSRPSRGDACASRAYARPPSRARPAGGAAVSGGAGAVAAAV
jgi:hypothetical protein